MLSAIKNVGSFAARLAASTRVLNLLERAESRHVNRLRVLTYHRVDNANAQPMLWPKLLSATPEAFARQMAYLADACSVVSMTRVIDSCLNGSELPPRSVLITFDDAYRDFAEHAWPTLRRHGLPATLFVPTGFPDQPQKTFWWDRLHQGFLATPRRDGLATPLGRMPLATAGQRRRACRRVTDYVKTLPHGAAMAAIDEVCQALRGPLAENHVLGWDALRQLAREGVTLAAHTRTHPLLHRLSVAEAEAEAVGSLGDLRREIGPVPPVFAYPDGGVNDAVANALRAAGFVLAFTTERGINHLPFADPLRLHRIHVGGQTTLPVLRAKLLRSSA